MIMDGWVCCDWCDVRVFKLRPLLRCLGNASPVVISRRTAGSTGPLKIRFRSGPHNNATNSLTSGSGNETNSGNTEGKCESRTDGSTEHTGGSSGFVRRPQHSDHEADTKGRLEATMALLGYPLNNPRCLWVGITCVYRNSSSTTCLAFGPGSQGASWQ